MWLKAEWMGHPMRLELTRVALLVKLANHYTTKGDLSWERITCFISFAKVLTLCENEKTSPSYSMLIVTQQAPPILTLWMNYPRLLIEKAAAIL